MQVVFVLWSCNRNSRLYYWLRLWLHDYLNRSHLRLWHRLHYHRLSLNINLRHRTQPLTWKVIKHDLSELKSLHVPVIVEMELNFFGIAMNFWEIKLRPKTHAKLQRSRRNFIPTSIQWMPDENSHMSWRLTRMITSTLETNTLEMQSFSELDLDPWTIVVCSFPLIPNFFAWAQQILRFTFWTQW